MKKLLIYLIIVLFTISSGAVIAGPKRKGDRGPTAFERDQQAAHEYRRQHPQQNRHHGHGYQKRYNGHREYHPRGYRGHWRSWDDWHHYYESHRHEYRNHRYYRHNGSLYFEFETDEGRFAFSIGR